MDTLETGGLTTQEFADYTVRRAQNAMYSRGPYFVWGWQVTVEEAYRFEPVEIHVSLRSEPPPAENGAWLIGG